MTTSTYQTTFRSGSARVDITPQLGTQITGFLNRRRPAEKIVDPLYARAVVFENDAERLCLIALDVTLVTRDYCDAVINRVCERHGFRPEAVMVHGTQTHAAPAWGAPLFDREMIPWPQWQWLRGLDREYSDLMADRAVEAVARALEKLQPASLGMGSCIEGRVAFNRRAVTQSGQVVMPPHRWRQPEWRSQFRYLEGPIDPELGVLATRTPGGAINTVMANYTCHPVHLFSDPGGRVSADWPGAMCDELENALGGGAVAVNGACGNINPWDPFDPDYREDHRRMGRILSDGVQGVLGAGVSWDHAPVLGCASRRLRLQYREQEPGQFESDLALLERYPEPRTEPGDEATVDSEWLFAALRRSVYLERQREDRFEYEIRVFRIGDAVIVGLPGEPFAEGGLQIKMASAAPFTWIAHNVSQYAGYIPVPGAFKHGGHEVNLTCWSKLAPEAWGEIAQASQELIEELMTRPPRPCEGITSSIYESNRALAQRRGER